MSLIEQILDNNTSTDTSFSLREYFGLNQFVYVVEIEENNITKHLCLNCTPLEPNPLKNGELELVENSKVDALVVFPDIDSCESYKKLSKFTGTNKLITVDDAIVLAQSKEKISAIAVIINNAIASLYYV